MCRETSISHIDTYDMLPPWGTGRPSPCRSLSKTYHGFSLRFLGSSSTWDAIPHLGARTSGSRTSEASSWKPRVDQVKQPWAEHQRNMKLMSFNMNLLGGGLNNHCINVPKACPGMTFFACWFLHVSLWHPVGLIKSFAVWVLGDWIWYIWQSYKVFGLWICHILDSYS